MTKAQKLMIAEAFADFKCTAGCGCCGDPEANEEAEKDMATILKVPMYRDKSGYNWSRYTTELRRELKLPKYDSIQTKTKEQ